MIEWTQSARKQSIGRAIARFAMQAAGITTVMADGKLLYVSADERGGELEIIAVPLDGGDLLVIRVMPTIVRRRNG